MREIKFREFYKKENIMYRDIDISNECLPIHDDNVVIMQFTGLFDKQGVEIYEGDIVKDLRSPFKDARSYSKVFYQEDRGRFVFGGWEIPAGMSHTFEVIGNIYENQELLRED